MAHSSIKRTKRKTHKKVVEYRTILFSDTIKAKFNEKTWESILAEARKFARAAAAKTAGKNQKSNRGKEIEIMEEPRTKFVVASDSE
ncbi:hypothetical protein F5887DRAFT_1283717 [Amanita rubescens]|nr:hypothetical protein F5887DRAFT_1283717 [Amanita rubescens]